MMISFDTATKKVSGLNVDTYLDDPKDVVTLAVKMASLPDGTNYVQQTVLDATAKQLQLTTTNSNYSKRSEGSKRHWIAARPASASATAVLGSKGKTLIRSTSS